MKTFFKFLIKMLLALSLLPFTFLLLPFFTISAQSNRHTASQQKPAQPAQSPATESQQAAQAPSSTPDTRTAEALYKEARTYAVKKFKVLYCVHVPSSPQLELNIYHVH